MKLIYNPTTKQIIGRTNATNVYTPHTVFIGTDAECDAKILELALTTNPPVPKSVEATAFFNSQPTESKEQFADLFRIVSSLRTDADKAKIISSLDIPDPFKPMQARLVEILTS